MKKNFTIAMIAVFLIEIVLFAMGCKKPKETVVPVVVMQESSVAVSYNKVWMVAEVTDDGGGLITERGFCYGIDEPFDTLLCEGNENLFTIELLGLSPSTTYACRAFARNEAGRGYSELYKFTTMSDTIPLVDTYTVMDITHCSAVLSGQVLNGGGQEVMERGFCYGTEPLPTVEGVHVSLGSGVGAFEFQLTDLLPDTKYFFRAYAVCTKGVYYGEQLVFVTKVPPMAVRTLSVSDVTKSRVMGEGEVICDGGYEVTECGFCWATEHNPTIEGLHIKASVGMGNFSYYFSGLEPGRKHYLRAYAINKEGVAYGNELEFVPDNMISQWPNGTLPGLFSVSEDRKVRFSQGNLQYYPDDNLWRFADDQWDFVGGFCFDDKLGEMNVGTVFANGTKCDNTKTYKYYTGWMDLFGWGTSGWDNGNTFYRPWNFTAHQYDCASYGPVGNFDLTGDYAEADWGIHNTIGNGGSRQWRTPTMEEIYYLLLERQTTSGIRFVKAVVAGVRGMIVLPDDWNASTYPLNAVNEHSDFNNNQILGKEWLEILEPAGAVFLPAGGERYQLTDYDGIWYDNVETNSYLVNGAYWTSTQSGVSIAYALRVLSYYVGKFIGGCIDEEMFRCNGGSVRLISDE